MPFGVTSLLNMKLALTFSVSNQLRNCKDWWWTDDWLIRKACPTLRTTVFQNLKPRKSRQVKNQCQIRFSHKLELKMNKKSRNVLRNLSKFSPFLKNFDPNPLLFSGDAAN